MNDKLMIEEVVNANEMVEFIEFPFRLYASDPNWVPPFIEERRDFFDRAKNPFFEHARCQLFLARRSGRVVGTIGAAVDDGHNRAHRERMGIFGFFESVDDPDVADALLRAAETWSAGQGMTFVRGPLNFSKNQEAGLLIDGYDEPPMIMMTHNLPYYSRLIEDCGYRKAMDLFAYIHDLNEAWQHAPPKVFRVAQKAAEKDGIRLRKIDLRRFEQESRLIKDVYNGALGRNWGFVPATEREFDHLAASLKPWLDPDLIFIAETPDGRPMGVSIALPDLNQAIRRSGGGHLFPLGLAKFMWHRRSVNQTRLMVIGVIEEYRGRGIDAAFYVETARAARARGYQRMEGSWVLESNTMMNRIIQRLGGKRYKTYRIYERSLI